jgi:hypothetical protein
MKQILIALVVVLSVLGLFLPNQVMAKTMGASVEDKHSDFYDAFLVLLDPYAGKAINKKYPNRNYGLWNAEILEIKRISDGSQYHFNVKVKYDTYTGPHNPPEGPVTLTFDIDYLEWVTVTEIKG